MQLPDLLFLVYDYLKFEYFRLEKQLVTTETQRSLSVATNTTISETISHISNQTIDKFATDANLEGSYKSLLSLSSQEESGALKTPESPDSIQELQCMHTKMNGRIEELSKSVDKIKKQLFYISSIQENIQEVNRKKQK